MTTTEQMTPANLSALEKDLRDLWKEMAQKSQKENQQAVMRACVLNLIVYASGERAIDEVSAIMSEVSSEHPARIMILAVDDSKQEAGLQAWVTALCHFQPGGRRQVCCEQILFRASSANASLLPGAVRPLIVPEIPVVVWWRHSLDVREPIFVDLIESASRAVIDTSRLVGSIQDLAQYVKKERQWTAFSDLSWAKLTPRRMLISGFFDAPDRRALLDKIERIEIFYSFKHNAPPAQAMLLSGWLASRLQWKPKSKIQADGPLRRLALTANQRPVTIEWKTEESEQEGVVRVRLYIQGINGYFQVSVTEKGEHLQTESTLAGMTSPPAIAIRYPWSETQLIHRELEIMGHDSVYEEALIFLADI